MFVPVLFAVAIVPMIAALFLGLSDRGILAMCSGAVSLGTIVFTFVFVGRDDHAWTSDLSTRVADFDTAPVCYRHEPDIVCCGMAGKMTCMIDRRDP